MGIHVAMQYPEELVIPLGANSIAKYHSKHRQIQSKLPRHLTLDSFGHESNDSIDLIAHATFYADLCCNSTETRVVWRVFTRLTSPRTKEIIAGLAVLLAVIRIEIP